MWRDGRSTMLYHIFCDDSPQKRGLELFASSMDISIFTETGPAVRHYLLPMICIGVGSLSLYGKVLALLWIKFLVIGPDYL